MATVGQRLSAPEAGWKRYDDTDQLIEYENGQYGWVADTSWSDNWMGTQHFDHPNGNEKIKFNFTGTKLRILAPMNTTCTNKARITIDGLEYFFTQYANTWVNGALCFEIMDLTNIEHSVIINVDLSAPPVNGTRVLALDAIDIDKDGILKPYNPDIAPILAPSNLIIAAGNSQVTLSWDAVTGATGYNVKRSTTAGGPYTTIASNVSGTSHVDTDVINGTTYYYVVTAVTSDDESANSNEASATPTAPSVEEGEAVLRVTMIDSSEREYELTTGEIDGFINWFNNHTSGDPASYMLNKSTGLRTSKEYLAFDKIISFEVTEIK